MIELVLLAAAALRPELAPLEPLAGHCWVGQSPDGKPDTHCFEPVYGGVLLRDTHEVPGNPPYRGETIYRWNKTAKRIEWAYWNSFGDEYRGAARTVGGGVDFTDERGAPVTAWRWHDGGYTVTNAGGKPVRFTRK